MATVGFTGHQHIPGQALEYVKEELERTLDGYGSDLIGVCSLAVGADQLFASLVLAKGGSLHVVLPCEGYEATFGDEAALACFRNALSRADAVETLPYPAPSHQAFLHAGQRVVEVSETLLAVWDGRAARGLGGTADVVRFARDRDVGVTVIWPARTRR